MTVPDYTRLFALDYAGARAKFLAATAAANCAFASYRHPDAMGPRGEELFVDVARLGSAKAKRQLIIISGTHGLEGASGSAAQIAWLESSGARKLPPGVSILLIHALNPYGFAYGTRTTENNVDLNRNFVDHKRAYPANPGYDEIFAKMLPRDWTPAALTDFGDALAVYREKHGADALFDALVRGQYTHPEGTNYGGRGREWSNRTLQRIVDEHLGAARQVGLIDWHTGIGEWGRSFFLCFNEDGSPLQAEAVRWWGSRSILEQRPHGFARPNYQGLVFNGLAQFLGNRPMVGAVIEFGTRGPNMRRALHLDIWLKFRAEKESERVSLLRADLHDAFVPVSSHWREETSSQAIEITQQAVNGLATWSLTPSAAATSS